MPGLGRDASGFGAIVGFFERRFAGCIVFGETPGVSGQHEVQPSFWTTSGCRRPSLPRYPGL